MMQIVMIMRRIVMKIKGSMSYSFMRNVNQKMS